MTWIKQNYDRFLLALMALALALCAGLLFNNARNFNAVFASLSGQVHHSEELPVNPLDKTSAEEKDLATPKLWDSRMINNRRLPLFVSPPYIAKTEVDANGLAVTTLKDPYSDDPNGILHPPVPNKWLIENNQDLLASNVLDQDTDGDGFSTLDEWLGHTNPQDKNSHPPYWTKLFLKRFYRIPFRLVFSARNGDRLQINTVDLDQPTQFLKVGDTVKGTKFKVTKFEEKHKMDNGLNRDVSEVTLVNDTGQTVVLPKEEEVDSPTTYAIFSYLWSGPGAKPEFAVLKGGEFSLKPDDSVKYRVLEMNDTAIKVLKVDENKELMIKMRPQGS